MISFRLIKFLVVLGAIIFVGWMFGLAVLAAWLWRLGWRLYHTRKATRLWTSCPRGHAVAQYGLWRCSACSGVSESWAWECPLCGAQHGWISCSEPSCLLAVTNPMLH